jgi:hypothetical protein
MDDNYKSRFQKWRGLEKKGKVVGILAGIASAASASIMTYYTSDISEPVRSSVALGVYSAGYALDTLTTRKFLNEKLSEEFNPLYHLFGGKRYLMMRHGVFASLPILGYPLAGNVATSSLLFGLGVAELVTGSINAYVIKKISHRRGNQWY